MDLPKRTPRNRPYSWIVKVAQKPPEILPRLPTWRQMNMDTDPQTEAVLCQIWRATPVWRKWEIMEQLNRDLRVLALAGLRLRNPQAAPEQLRRLIADMLLEPELAAKAYGPLDTSR